MTSRSVGGRVQLEVVVQPERQRARDRPGTLGLRERVLEQVRRETLE